MARTAETGVTRPTDVIYRVLKALRESLLLSFVAIGILLLVTGTIFEIANVTSTQITEQDGVIAGMLGVFGASSIVAAGAFYVLLQAVQRR